MGRRIICMTSHKNIGKLLSREGWLELVDPPLSRTFGARYAFGFVAIFSESLTVQLPVLGSDRRSQEAQPNVVCWRSG